MTERHLAAFFGRRSVPRRTDATLPQPVGVTPCAKRVAPDRRYAERLTVFQSADRRTFGVPVRSARICGVDVPTPNPSIHVEPSPNVFVGSSWRMRVTVIVGCPPSGSTTSRMLIGIN